MKCCICGANQCRKPYTILEGTCSKDTDLHSKPILFRPRKICVLALTDSYKILPMRCQSVSKTVTIEMGHAQRLLDVHLKQIPFRPREICVLALTGSCKILPMRCQSVSKIVCPSRRDFSQRLLVVQSDSVSAARNLRFDTDQQL